jgi:lipid-A-disaccharide synthase
MRIFFSAGEPSGDEHASHLIHELKQRDPTFECDGFGGPEMQQQGCELLHEMTQTAVMGFFQVIPLLAHFRRLVKQAESHLQQHRPDAVVLVDFPGFNWWIAQAAKKQGIPVYYYMPPQLWAWAPWRIRRVRKWVDHVICALPFEYEWYSRRGVACTWVGHPFFDEVADDPVNVDTMTRLRMPDEAGPVFGLLPGSRNQELERNWPIMLQVVQRVHEALPDVRWIVGCYRDQHFERCRELQQEAGITADLHYETGHTSEVIEAADACLMVSGSVSLELLARRTPGVVLYQAGRLASIAGRLLIHCRFITLTNLIAGREVMPEFISVGDPQPAIRQISAILTDWGSHPESLASVRREMDELAATAAVTGATTRTAELLLSKHAESVRRAA